MVLPVRTEKQTPKKIATECLKLMETDWAMEICGISDALRIVS